MKPVVLISRTTAGDAFVYARYESRLKTDELKFDGVPVGEVLPTLTPEEVELLRADPKKVAA